jgi:hypothetical protein
MGVTFIRFHQHAQAMQTEGSSGCCRGWRSTSSVWRQE